MSKWNYRVFRCVDQDGSSYYEMREAHYDEAGNITGWTEGASSPFGETLDELVSDFAWFVASLNKPVLDDKTGTECEPTIWRLGSPPIRRPVPMKSRNRCSAKRSQFNPPPIP